MTNSASSARIQGDDFQHLFAWHHALRLMLPEEGVSRVEVESEGAGNVDDVVVRRPNHADEYYQVKFSVDASTPVSSAWLTAAKGSKGKSLLQRFAATWALLSKQPGHVPEMALFTNKVHDPHDPILQLRDGRRGVVGPRLALETAGSRAGQQRAQWAQHVGLTDGELLDVLHNLKFMTDRGSADELAISTGDRMRSLGLAATDVDISTGVNAIRDWVKAGIREIDASLLSAELERCKLLGGPRYTTLLIEAIDHAPWPDAASVRLDWVDLFEGTEPRARTQLKDPSLWSGKLRPEMVRAAQTLKARNADRVVVRGYMRLPLWFLAGVELPATRGHHVACTQLTHWWTSEAAPAPYEINSVAVKLDQGRDLAIVLSVANPVTDDVIAYCRRSGVPVAQVIDLRPTKGPGQKAIENNGEALGWAIAVRDALRTAIRDTGASRIHLFMSGPAGGALFLGHYWNRVAPTLVYEHLGGATYAPTFEVP
ncbi:MAG: SAVED domain-containing protein [Deltaproteobacteria bacterium]|nr:SAVED domain-containing protein [Deltaproteobacteria bacterium]